MGPNLTGEMSSVPPPAPPRSTPPPSWPALLSPPPGDEGEALARERLWVAPAAVVLGLCIGLVSQVVVELIGIGFGASAKHPGPTVTIVASLALDLSFVGAALYFTSLRGRPSPAAFGYRPAAWGRAVTAFVGAGLVYYLVTWAYGIVFDIHGTDKLPSDFGVQRSTWALAGTAAFVCVVAPICEEFFFRGFFFGVLSRGLFGGRRAAAGPLIAAVITGILFGLAHTGSVSSAQYLIPLGFLGFMLCMMRWWTGSLYPGMALHAFNNVVALGVLLGWSVGSVAVLLAGVWALVAGLTVPLARWRG